MKEANDYGWYGEGLPPIGMTCVAIPHDDQSGFLSADPVGAVIKAYDGNYVWMLVNREHYITTHLSKVTFQAVATQNIAPAQKPQVERLFDLVLRHLESKDRLHVEFKKSEK